MSNFLCVNINSYSGFSSPSCIHRCKEENVSRVCTLSWNENQGKLLKDINDNIYILRLQLNLPLLGVCEYGQYCG